MTGRGRVDDGLADMVEVEQDVARFVAVRLVPSVAATYPVERDDGTEQWRAMLEVPVGGRSELVLGNRQKSLQGPTWKCVATRGKPGEIEGEKELVPAHISRGHRQVGRRFDDTRRPAVRIDDLESILELGDEG